MTDPNLVPGADTLMASTLLVSTLLLSVFRLGELFTKPKSSLRRRRPPCGQHKNGQLIFTDPDGRIPRESRPRR
jgi:hypothetical protein